MVLWRIAWTMAIRLTSTGCGKGVAEIGFAGGERTITPPAMATAAYEGILERLDFDRIAQACARAMSDDVLDLRWVDAETFIHGVE